MKLIRKYINLCKTKEPVVSEELTEYIVGMYIYTFCVLTYIIKYKKYIFIVTLSCIKLNLFNR